MASKALFLLALLAAAAVLATAAEDHAHDNKVKATTQGVGVNDHGGGGGGGGGGHHGGGGCNYGCCYYHGKYGCQRCCASPDEVPQQVKN